MSPKTAIAVGPATCGLAVVLMIAGLVGVGWGSAIGMLGVGVIAGASRSRRRPAG